MSKVSAKRQITLPVDQCQALGIHPGDEIEFFSYEGVLSLVKKTPGKAFGILKNSNTKSDISDDEALADYLNDRH